MQDNFYIPMPKWNKYLVSTNESCFIFQFQFWKISKLTPPKIDHITFWRSCTKRSNLLNPNWFWITSYDLLKTIPTIYHHTRDGWINEFIKRKWSSGLFWAVRGAEKKTHNCHKYATFLGSFFKFLWAKNFFKFF